MLNENLVREKMIAYIIKVSKRRDIDPEQDIFQMHFSNSLFIMQLVLFIEKEFDISVDNSDIGSESFRSINKICSYILEKTR